MGTALPLKQCNGQCSAYLRLLFVPGLTLQPLLIDHQNHGRLPTERAAYEWVSKPNNAPLFRGKTALSRMLAGRVSDLYVVRKYLDQELG